MPTGTRKKPFDAKKGQVIEQATEWYSRSSGIFFADYRGMTVKEIQTLRRSMRKQGAEVHVLKNTLFRKAAGADVDKMPYELHNGPTAVAFVFENEPQAAKALLDFATANKKMTVKGGFIGGQAMDAKQVEALSKLPTKDVLIAQVIGAIAAPLTQLVGVVEALYADPIRVVGAVADKVAEGSPIPAPAAEAAPEPEAEAPVAEAEAPAVEANEDSAPAEAAAEATTEEAPSEE